MNFNPVRFFEKNRRLLPSIPIFKAVALFCLIAGQGAVAAGPLYVLPATHRADINLDEGWRFIREDAPGATEPGFDDAKWESVTLPHTWNNLDGQDGGVNYYRGPGWYRKHFKVDGAYAGRRLFLKFDGAFSATEVWVNGIRLGEHRGGFAAFVFDATPFLKVGSDNLLAVKVSNAFDPDIPPLSADFTFFGGLYRDVHLLVTDDLHISPLDYGSSGVYLKTTDVNSNSARLEVTAVISNAAPSPASVAVNALVVDANNGVVARLAGAMTLPAATASNVVMNTIIDHPHLWDGVRDPYLYRVFVEVDRGSEVVDMVGQTVGFRWFNFDPDKGFSLNGHPYDLHGTAFHQDGINRGWAVGQEQREKNFALLQEIGATALRLSHYEHAEGTYDLADEDGIVLWTEIPVINSITESPGFYANAKQQLTELIHQRYNHPSVICWGIYNEIMLKKGPVTTNLVSQLAALAAELDSTRPSTCAIAGSDSQPANWYTRISAFNKYLGWYGGKLSDFGPSLDRTHARYPDRCIGVSEFGTGASVAQHYEEPYTAPPPKGRFHPEEYQNLFHEVYWQELKRRPYIWCKFVWTLADFAADDRNEGDTPGRNDKGLVTYDRQIRKDAFYWYQANWTTKPMVYITGHHFTNRLADSFTAKVYANCDSVDLSLNGILQGTRASTNCIFTWPIKLRPGTNAVRAIGKKDSVTVTDSLNWVAPPAEQK
ncbi:MAG TPA: glycoside hydrolase family 2 TIM barrel-domain containing protein [Verrucomicrobiae bacterium]|jgi:beta-galactosidase|nr:glycoside hydrolase family 2 TIM barrel-domain containing protein [Verrucomicrobiae bacterium]